MRRIAPLAELAARISSEPAAAVPPRRFAAASFSNYRPAHPSQDRACRLVREFVARKRTRRGRGPWSWLRRHDERTNAAGTQAVDSAGLYLDGGYGVGKTHLLAAAFHASTCRRKAYLTFQELVHLIGALGMTVSRERFATVELLCLDEFELDDPGNTLIVKRFLEPLFASGGAVITTSNTPPEAQGRGRFNAEDFRREIQGIAGHFHALSLTGNDYRHRERRAELLCPAELASQWDGSESERTLVSCDLDELLAVLRGLHPVRYGSLLRCVGAIFVRDVKVIPSQSDALRFVHFIDQLYDRQVGMRASGTVPLTEIFDASYRRGAYQKKHERCISRLGELLDEPLPTD